MKKFLFFTLLLILASCANGIPKPAEGVLVVDNEADSLVLRKKCGEIPLRAIGSRSYVRLVGDMLTKVQSPEYDGVGIAGPQVGVSLRIVAVQRFDREGEPFEVYPNIHITAMRGEKEIGPEGCLSVPGRRGDVSRWRDIDIRYTSPVTLRDTVESVSGFTAVIFQHECDHLDGILYTDRI